MSTGSPCYSIHAAGLSLPSQLVAQAAGIDHYSNRFSLSLSLLCAHIYSYWFLSSSPPTCSQQILLRYRFLFFHFTLCRFADLLSRSLAPTSRMLFLFQFDHNHEKRSPFISFSQSNFRRKKQSFNE